MNNMNNITCECHLCDINNESTDKYCCQTKVNKLQMTMKQYEDICKDKPPLVAIDDKEANRLFNIWNEYGCKYIVNEKNGMINFL